MGNIKLIVNSKWTPFRTMSEIPSKFTESAWIFLCDSSIYKALTWENFKFQMTERHNVHNIKIELLGAKHR